MTLQEIIKNENVKFVDVRTEDEFETGHYPGAINIPLQKLRDKTEELKKLNSPLVVYCQSGGRSYSATLLLKQLGFSDVYNAGGLYDLMMLKNLN